MKKVALLIGFIVLIITTLFFKLNKNSKGNLVVKLNETIDINESNEVFIYEGTKNVAYDFITSIVKKKQFFDSFDVYLTKEGKSTQGKFLTRIQTSKGALKYFNQISSEDELLSKIKIGRAKQFYECINICLSKELIKTKMCSCGAYFMDY